MTENLHIRTSTILILVLMSTTTVHGLHVQPNEEQPPPLSRYAFRAPSQCGACQVTTVAAYIEMDNFLFEHKTPEITEIDFVGITRKACREHMNHIVLQQFWDPDVHAWRERYVYDFAPAASEHKMLGNKTLRKHLRLQCEGIMEGYEALLVGMFKSNAPLGRIMTKLCVAESEYCPVGTVVPQSIDDDTGAYVFPLSDSN